MLDCLPAAFFAGGIFDTLSEQIIAHETAKLKRPLADRDQMKRKLLELEGKQQNIIQQISDRAAEAVLAYRHSTTRSTGSKSSDRRWRRRSPVSRKPART